MAWKTASPGAKTRTLRRRLSNVTAALAASAGLLCPVPALAAVGHITAGRVSAGHVSADVVAKPQLPSIRPCKHMIKRGNAQFLVWVCNSGKHPRADLSTVLKLANQYAPEMIKLMGKPQPDSGGLAGGGDTRIDIYLVNGTAQSVERDGSPDRLHKTNNVVDDAMTVSTDRHGDAASGYMLLNRQRMGGKGFASDFVHEFFHVLQYHYNIGSCNGGEWWFTEASATWAESYWVASTAPGEVYKRYVENFEKNPELSLTDTRNLHDYASFIWPYFMQQQKGADAIASVWKSLPPRNISCRAMNQRLDAQLSFADNFRDFAVRNLDQKFIRDSGEPEWPQDFGKNYQDLHNDFPETWPDISNDRQFTAAGQSQSLKLDLPPLSVTYAYINTTAIGDPVMGIHLDMSGLSDTEGLSVDVLGYESDQSGHNHWIRIRESSPDNGVCMAWDPGDTEDTALVLVISNSSLTQTTRGTTKIQARGACATSASGTVTHTQHVVEGDDTYTDTVDTTVSMNLKFVASGNDMVSNGSTFTYTVSGTHNDGSTTCDFGGSGNGSMDPSAGSGSYADLYGYVASKDNPPHLTEVAYGPSLSGCGGGYVLNDSALGCPIVPSNIYFPPPEYEGAYSADSSVISFNCNDSSGSQPTVDIEDLTENVTGTLTAQGVIPCGLWTAGCVDGSPTAKAAKPGFGLRR